MATLALSTCAARLNADKRLCRVLFSLSFKLNLGDDEGRIRSAAGVSKQETSH